MNGGTVLQAGLWGWLAASSLLLGAAVGSYVSLPRKVVASIMAYGSGVLIAAICFDQLPDALRLGGHWVSLCGMFSGGLAFVLACRWLDSLQVGGRGALVGLLIAAGAFLDGIPESLGLGLGVLQAGQVSLVMLVAIFLSNLPEGLASAASLRAEGRSRCWVFGLWGGDCAAVRPGGYGWARAVCRAVEYLAGFCPGLFRRSRAMHAGR